MRGRKVRTAMLPAHMDDAAQQKPHIVLTGATGFIGRHLQRHLLDAGYRITAVVRPDSTNTTHLLPAVEKLKARLDEEAVIAPLLARCDYLIYAAGSVRGRTYEDFTEANDSGVERLARLAAAQMPQPRFLLLSSLAAGKPHLSHYAASKRAGEDKLSAEGNLNWIIVRPPAVYGPGDVEMRPLLQSIRYGLALRVGPSLQRLSLLYVGDLAKAIGALLDGFDACQNRIFELDDGTKDGYSWAQIVQAARGRLPVAIIPAPRWLLRFVASINFQLSHWLNYQPMLTPGKVNELSENQWLCNNSLLYQHLEWRPQVKLREGVCLTFVA